MAVVYAIEHRLAAEEFVELLRRSGLAARRPVEDSRRIAKMLEHGNLIVTARDQTKLVGVARSLTDFSFACYLSDLAVDRAYRGQGIGRRLIDETRRAVAPHSMVLLLAAPDAMSYYAHIGMSKVDNAFMCPRR